MPPDTPDIQLYSGDCIPGAATYLRDESCDFFVSSIPFGSLFSYSHKLSDIGNNKDGVDMDEGQFGLHMRFFIEQLHRVMKPGCIVAIHVQQLLCYKIQHGFMGMRDFCGAVVRLFKRHGFQPHGEFVIGKNPRQVARKNQLHSLMFVTASRDSRDLAPAMNDYVLLFKKPGTGGNPVRGIIETNKSVFLVEPSPIIEYHDGLTSSPGSKKVNKRVRANFREIPYQVHQYDEETGAVSIETVTGGEHINQDGWFTKNDWVASAHGTWTDILEIDVLENWKQAKDHQEEKHVCPLQLNVVRRLVKLYSSPGDTVDDWFSGIGTTAVVCVEQHRNFRGFELKESYHRMGVANVAAARRERKQLNLWKDQ